MKVLMEFLIVLAGVVSSWHWAAAWRRKQGYGPVFSHLTGAFAGGVTFMLLMTVIVIVDPPPNNPPASTAAPMEAQKNATEAQKVEKQLPKTETEAPTGETK